jgi:hypothetical protein
LQNTLVSCKTPSHLNTIAVVGRPKGNRNAVIERRPSARAGGPEEAAHYSRDAITDLAQMAHRHRLEMLGHLLDMALMEADEWCARGGRSAR